MNVGEAIEWARNHLPEGDGDGDGLVLLAHLLQRNRAWLFAFAEAELTSEQEHQFLDWVERASAGEPVAYLIGQWEFWSLTFQVTPDTLIPRADTETLVRVALELSLPVDARVIDLGTGSGAIACALASERPDWQVEAVDRSRKALAVAASNAERLGLQRIQFRVADWLDGSEGQSYDLIVSNPPYIPETDAHLDSVSLKYEPAVALVADEEGMGDLRRIGTQARSALAKGGWLLVEHGFDQGDRVRTLLQNLGYQQVGTQQDLAGRDRVCMAQWSG